ncbi:Formamidopyrimidine-DNA glycosylase [Ancistrocladus abbreviatus]
MPELPEVEAARRAIQDHCVGKKIVKSVIANDSKVIDGVSASDFEASILNKTIVAAHRKGKNMWLQLDSPPFPSFQFGMTGAIYIKGVAVTKYKRAAVTDTDEWPSKYSKVFVELNDGLEFSFTDKRRFAKVRLLDNPASLPPISELGPDALLELMNVDELFNALSKKKIGIKALLLDQSFISGIGNWVADEVLYQARIHPMQIASSLFKESCAALHRCIKEVIEKAVEVGADSSQYPSDWIFHFREMKPGKAFVNGKKIEFINAGGRTTAYVPELQKLSGAQASKPAAKSRKASRKKKDGDDDDKDNEIEEPESGEEDERNVESKPQQSSNDGERKKQSKSNKSTRIDDDDAGQRKPGNKGRRAPTKRKSPVSGNDDDDANRRKKSRVEGKKDSAKISKVNTGPKGRGGHDDDTDDKGDEKKSSRVTKGRQRKVDNSSKKKMDAGKNDKKIKKKGK